MFAYAYSHIDHGLQLCYFFLATTSAFGLNSLSLAPRFPPVSYQLDSDRYVIFSWILV